jgi:hypothetical protein
MSDDSHILYIIDDIDHHDRILERMQRIHPGVEIRVRTWKQMHDEFPRSTGKRPELVIIDEIAHVPDPRVMGLIVHRMAEYAAALSADVVLVGAGDYAVADLKTILQARQDCIRPQITDITHSKRRSKGERHANKRWRWS